MRTCTVCELEKTLDQFDRTTRTIDGRREQCKSCRSEYYQRHRATWSEEYKQKRADDKRYWRIQKKYGLTREQYEKMLLSQNSACAICLKPEGGKYREKVIHLSVDHDHNTGRVRGLLCRDCNTAIGKLREDTEAMNRAVIYLSTEWVGWD